MANKLIPHKLFDKFGVKMSYVVASSPNNSFDFHAFLQPLRYKNKLYLSGVPTELGYDGLNKYLLLAPPELRSECLTDERYTVTFDGGKYATDHCEPVFFGRKCVYYWAIVHKEG